MYHLPIKKTQRQRVGSTQIAVTGYNAIYKQIHNIHMHVTIIKMRIQFLHYYRTFPSALRCHLQTLHTCNAVAIYVRDYVIRYGSLVV